MAKTNYITDIKSLLQNIKDSGLTDSYHSHLRVWFRGHSDKAWQLTPGVYRPSFDCTSDDKRLNKELEQYLESNSWEHLNSKNMTLQNWICHQRAAYKNKKLAEEYVVLLNKLGIDWDPAENNWHTMYKAFLDYKKTHGSVRVSHADKSVRRLWTWCVSQRDNYRSGKMATEKLQLLNEAQFEWVTKKIKWKTKSI